MRCLIDASIPMYAAGREHEYREPCRLILLACVAGAVEAVTDAQVLQEILYRFSAIGRRPEGIALCRDFMAAVPDILPILSETVSAAASMMEAHEFLPARDAIHAAAAQAAQVEAIISTDRHFERLPSIRRLDPIDFAEL
ncbi:MAG: type II toxin-antitoxin system VapC family toxin [Armatimonadetes bacterium]|nr:type II toxin-antitoxin system VapC family toxin [Armatimonadota bacterium]MDI9583552.1 PIN domain-containing protein [Acidobacteriota bacterium]